MQSKGLEMPGYDPRGSFGMALAYASSDRGACHMRSFPIGAEVVEGSLPADTLLCPGHGPLTTVAEEKAHNPFF